MKKIKIISLSIAFLSLCFFATSSLLTTAAITDDANYDLSGVNNVTPTEDEYKRLEESSAPTVTGLSCDEFYDFGSIGSEIKPERYNYKAGEEITFKGFVENKNNHPVVNGGLYVQILRTNKEGTLLNGDHIIDEFFAKEDISLAPNSKQQVEFKWVVPGQSIDGGYTMATFFVVDKKFNLSGLSFWNHLYAGFSNFIVTGTQNGVYFDRNKVKINNKAVELRATSEPLASSSPIEIKVPLQNKLSKKADVKVYYTLYYWDSLQKENILEQKEETLSLAANSSKEITYTISKPELPAYYLNMTLEGEGFKSTINIRPGVDASKPRINFAGVNKFPLAKGDNATSFVCFHNTSFLEGPNVKIEQTVKDRNGNVLDKLEYMGVTGRGEISATKKEFIAQEDYDYLTVESKAFNEAGELIEQSSLVYDCDALGEDYCKKKEAIKTASGSKFYDWVKRSAVLLIYIALIIVLILITIVVLRRKKEINPTIVILFVVIATLSFFAFESNRTLSYTVTDPTTGADMFPFRSRIHTRITYDINLRQTGVNLTDGQTLPSGNNIDFSFDKNGEWAREGGGMDTPPVSWDTWSGAGCSDYYFSNGSCENQGWWGFVRCNAPATRQVTAVSGPVTCDGSTCTITGYTTPGSPIVVKTSISKTDCATRIYARGTGSNSGSCAWSCFSNIGGDTSVCSDGGGGAPCTAANYLNCRCNDRAGGTADNCPERSSCRLFQEIGYPNFVPANDVNWTFYYPVPFVCGDGVREGAEQCDLGDATHGDGNGACPKDCSSSCTTNTECPCVGADCGGGGIGTACSSVASCQTGLCCSASGTCQANCIGSTCTGEGGGKKCCSDGTWRTDCNCLTEPSSAVQQCCTVDRIWREKCTGCERDNQCATSRAECCSEEFGTCTIDQTYCVDADFNLISDGDIAIYLTANPGEHSGSTRVKVTSAGGFHKDIEFSPISTSPDSGLKNGMLNWASMFNPTPLASTGYAQGSIVTVKVPYDIIPIGTSKTYRMMIKGVADEIEKVKEITVKIYGQGWSQP